MLINNLLTLDFEPVSRHPATGLFQASRAPALPCGSFESETTDHCERIGTWRDSGSYAPFELWCPVPQGKSGSEQAIIH